MEKKQAELRRNKIPVKISNNVNSDRKLYMPKQDCTQENKTRKNSLRFRGTIPARKPHFVLINS